MFSEVHFVLCTYAALTKPRTSACLLPVQTNTTTRGDTYKSITNEQIRYNRDIKSELKMAPMTFCDFSNG